MVEKPNDIESIYNAALEKTSEAERSAYLDVVCGDDFGLRAGVEELLKARDEVGDFLESPPVASNVTVERTARLEDPSTVINHYELLELIGEGGMGLVYLAQQKEPVKRYVALKIIKPGMDSKQVIARFEVEKQALALLDHPNIAHVFDAGTTETGRPYFVMEYVKGTSIIKYCDERKLNIEQRLRLFEQVCEGIHHAHQKGIIHRDIKPSNILISVHGEKAIPKIIDFGIAKAMTLPLTDKTFVTFRGQLLGTPDYMSPEQVDLATQDIDTRSDIYSLGVVMYELLAGVLPFDSDWFEGMGFTEIQRTIREKEPASPSLRLTGLGEQAKAIAASRGTHVIQLARRLHRELEWIPLKAMRKDRCRRYKSASDMADDIRNYLNGNPLIAGPETATYRIQKFVRKHAGSVATVVLVAAAIVVGLIISTVMYYRAENARQKEADARKQAEQATKKETFARREADQQRQRAEANEKQAQKLHYVANMNLAQYAYEKNKIGRVRELLEETASYPDRGFEWYYWQRQAHRELRTFRGHTDEIYSVAFSPDGRRIATGSLDTTAKIWDAASGEELMTLRGYSDIVYSVAFSPDGRRLCTGAWEIKVWDLDSGKQLLNLGTLGQIVQSVAFSLDGRRIAAGSMDGVAKIWDANSGKELLTLGAMTVTFSPNGQRILTTSYDGTDSTVKICDANSGEQLFGLKGHTGWVSSAVFSPDGQRIATGAHDEMVNIWDANTGKELLSFRTHNTKVASVAYSPDGQQIVTACADLAIIWDATSGRELVTLKPGSEIMSVDFSPDGQQVLTGGRDGTVRLWDAASSNEDVTLRGHSDTVTSVVFSPNGKHILTGSRDKTARLWEAASCKELVVFKGHTSSVQCAMLSPDGQWIATGSADGTAKLWEVGSGKELLTLKGHNSPVYSVAFSPDGKRIVTGCRHDGVKVWDVNSGKEQLGLWHDQLINSVAFSPDGQRILAGCFHHIAKLWDANSAKELLTLKHGYYLECVAFSPDGRQVATGGRDGTVRLWDSTTGKELLTLKGHSNWIRRLAFSSDGGRIITSCYNGTAKIWDVASGRELLTLKLDSGIWPVTFSPDVRQVVTGHSDGTVRIWQAASVKQVAAWQQEEKAVEERIAARQREREREEALRTQEPGAIKQWLVLVPLAFDGRDEVAALKALDQQQLPQEATLRPQAGDRVKIGEVERTWEAVQLEDNLIDFNRLLGEPTNYSLAYAVCYIDSEGEHANLVMKVSSGDPLKIYLNGREVDRREWSLQDYTLSEADVTGIELKAGRNVLMLKVVNLVGDWRSSVWLMDSAGQPVKGIQVTLEPSKEPAHK